MNNKLILPSKDNPIPALQRVPSHHSVPRDWSFWRVNTEEEYTGWYLDDVEFVSSPSCLNLYPPIGYGPCYALSEYAQTGNMLEGRIITYLKYHNYRWNYFWLHLAIPYKGAMGTRITPTYLNYEWQRYRITWWFAYDYQNTPSTRVRLERWNVDDWLLLSETDYPAFSGSPNYIAIGGGL